jgi:integrase
MAASMVRQIHSIISAALSAAVRWEWIVSNPARVAQRPRLKAPEPDPPSAPDAARLLDAAFEMDDDWGTLVWLVMTTGIRRGEVCALRWRHVDLDGETIEIRRAYTLHKGVGVEKDTKTHQIAAHRARLGDGGTPPRAPRPCSGSTCGPRRPVLRADVRVHEREDPDHSRPYSPHAVSSRYKEMAERLGIDTHLGLRGPQPFHRRSVPDGQMGDDDVTVPTLVRLHADPGRHRASSDYLRRNS